MKTEKTSRQLKSLIGQFKWKIPLILDFDHHTCQCKNGFFGDGLDCEYFGVNVIEGDCERDSQCNVNEKCVINFKLGALTYSCVEKNGGSHIEKTTEKIRKPDLCLDNSECEENAECSYDSEEFRYKCQCKILHYGPDHVKLNKKQ